MLVQGLTERTTVVNGITLFRIVAGARRTKIFYALLSAWLLGLSAAASGDMSDFDRGNAAYIDGLYGEAAQFWTRAAEKEDPLSQFNLGILFEHGKGVSQDMAQAVYWYSLAANQNLPGAQTNLANIFVKGTAGVPRNVSKAVFWYLKAADLGHADAQFSLAKLLLDGAPPELAPDPEAAESWLQVAARNGHTEAESVLYRMQADAERERFGHIRGQHWVLQQPDNAWTVELYRAEERREALTFVETIGLGEAAVVPGGSGEHSVLAGVFESEVDARKAIADLPTVLRARFPEPRQFGAIKRHVTVATGTTPEAQDNQLLITEYDASGAASTRPLTAPANAPTAPAPENDISESISAKRVAPDFSEPATATTPSAVSYSVEHGDATTSRTAPAPDAANALWYVALDTADSVEALNAQIAQQMPGAHVRPGPDGSGHALVIGPWTDRDEATFHGHRARQELELDHVRLMKTPARLEH